MRGDKTRRKLDEAKFFLDQLQPNYGKAKKFDFYLSAYISAARSVLWIMKAEYGRVPGWKSWYASQKPNSEERALLKGTNELRTRTTKREPLSTLASITLEGIKLSPEQAESFRSHMTRAKGKKLPIRISGTAGNFLLEIQIDGEWISYQGAEMLATRQLPEFPQKNILDVCNRYYDAIARVVAKCAEQFDA
jgi:hypothetical protein